MKKLIPILILFMACRSVNSHKETVTEKTDSYSERKKDSSWMKQKATWNDLFQAGNVHIHIGLSSTPQQVNAIPVFADKDPLSQLIEAAVSATNQQATGIDVTVGSISDQKTFTGSLDTGRVAIDSKATVNAFSQTVTKDKQTKSPFGVTIAVVLLLLLALAMYFVDQYFSTGRRAINAGADLIKKL